TRERLERRDREDDDERDQRRPARAREALRGMELAELFLEEPREAEAAEAASQLLGERRAQASEVQLWQLHSGAAYVTRGPVRMRCGTREFPNASHKRCG